MKTVFLGANQSMSDFMRNAHRNGDRVIACRGGFNEFGEQGWNISFLPG